MKVDDRDNLRPGAKFFEWEQNMCAYIEDGEWAPVVELETV